jgi:hypothetical protein
MSIGGEEEVHKSGLTRKTTPLFDNVGNLMQPSGYISDVNPRLASTESHYFL